MSDVTRILSAIEQGDSQAADQLLPLVYEELRRLAAHKLAQEKPGQTLQATGLVHEAYIRLVDVEKVQHWGSRGHFFAAAAEAMRRILVENARRKNRKKRAGQYKRQDLREADLASVVPSDELLALDEALDQLARESPEKAELVKLRYFAGLTSEQAADALGISRATAARHWTYARAWLFERIREGGNDRRPGPLSEES
ncbi:MAG: ECF-type sigma factor [Planctomycetota bacterium]|jgi:RNA polymerase sigma factor (TIGR02999 family)